jgi:acyl-CoA thioester hydrolase
VPTVKLETYYKVFTDRRKDAHIRGQVTLCFMREDSRKPCRAPKAFVDKLTSAISKQ